MTGKIHYKIEEGVPEEGTLVHFRYTVYDTNIEWEDKGFLVQHWNGAFFKTSDGDKVRLSDVVWWKHIPVIHK